MDIGMHSMKTGGNKTLMLMHTANHKPVAKISKGKDFAGIKLSCDNLVCSENISGNIIRC